MLFSEFSVVRPRLLSLWAFVQDGPPADCTTGSAVAYPIGQEGQDGKRGRKGRMGGMSGDVWVVLYLSAGGMTALAQKPDIKAAQAEIMKADEDFNQSVADWNRERFLSLIADGATFGGGTPNEQKGKDAIWKAWSVFFDPKGPTLTWHPSKAEVLAGGEVGYTTGF